MKCLAVLVLCLSAGIALADQPEVVSATAQNSGGSWTVSVTIRHPDTGWDHYADGWEILAPDGTRLGFRELLHPHETEQPFTRSLGGIAVPAGITTLRIRARCSQDGWNEKTTTVQLD